MAVLILRIYYDLIMSHDLSLPPIYLPSQIFIKQKPQICYAEQYP